MSFSRIAIAMVLMATFQEAIAESHMFNNTDHKLDVYFTAVGCAAIKHPCGNTNKSVTYVCKHGSPDPGSQTTYSFKSGTSSRQINVYECRDSGGVKDEVRELKTDNGGHKKHCVTSPNADASGITAKCGYSDSEWQAIIGE